MRCESRPLSSAAAALVEVTRLAAVGALTHGYIYAAHVTLEAGSFHGAEHKRVAFGAQAGRARRPCRRRLPDLRAACGLVRQGVRRGARHTWLGVGLGLGVGVGLGQGLGLGLGLG